MGRTAGAQIHVRNLHKAHRAVNLFLAPIGQSGQHIRCRVPRMHRKVPHNRAVRLILQLLQLRLRKLPVVVHRGRPLA